ncbi:hypothetical protein [Tenacibaculum sp. C7A-26P2]|uniref:hypothetical protein n=1 Tax=Tenacibaculum sp. C7A-26P2 TaxID=3447504 RepID=UPI003F835E3A
MEIKVGKHTVKFYDSPENLSIKRYQSFNKYLMIDNEVGSSITDYDRRMQKAIRFLESDMKSEAIKELKNNRQNVFNCLNEYTPRNKALAILVKSIDKKVFTNINSNTLTEIENRLDEIGFTKEMMDDVLSQVKKKSS